MPEVLNGQSNSFVHRGRQESKDWPKEEGNDGYSSASAAFLFLPSLPTSPPFAGMAVFTALLPAFVAFLSFSSYSTAQQVTIYAQQGIPPQAQPTPCIGAVPCDGNVLTAVNSTTAPVNTTVLVQLFSGGMSGLSIPMSHFFGYSLELSVVDKLSTFFITYSGGIIRLLTSLCLYASR